MFDKKAQIGETMTWVAATLIIIMILIISIFFASGSDFFILDFYCHELQLGIELDGVIHETQQEYDIFRDTTLNEMGIHVLRFKNEEFDDFRAMMAKLADKISELKSSPS